MRYLIKISYDGQHFDGWQKQPNVKLKTIQGEVEKVLSNIIGEPIELTGSGRTDAGVSALCQVAHFDTTKVIPRGLKGHANSLLPDKIRILDIALTKDTFHARFDAKSKTYKYYFYTGSEKVPFYDRFATFVKYDLKDDIMQKAVQKLVGEHDFSAFCSEGSDVKSKVRTIYSATLEKHDNLYEFTIAGNGFLYNMVRIIVGTLIDLGRGKITMPMDKIIASKKRDNAGVTITAHGLVLLEVNY